MQRRIERHRVALVSSWQEVCGIAHYSYFLKRALDKHATIDVLPLPRLIMLDSSPEGLSAGDAVIAEVARKLTDYDVTCIQFEPGLFAASLTRVASRFRRIALASRGLVVAFHSVDRTDRSRSLIEALQPLIAASPGAAWHRLRKRNEANRRRQYWQTIYGAIAAKPSAVIAHTKRDALLLQRCIPGARVIDHPLCYMEDDDIVTLETRALTSNLADRLPPHEGKRFVGLFGFLAEYKGFDVAVRALKHLPPHYEMLMFSNLHESRIYNRMNFEFLDHLVTLVEDSGLASRVHFVGSVGDDDLLIGMMLCDAVVMPYLNTGHSASGPASQAIELSRPVYCSRSVQFLELAKYFPDHLRLFDVGNHLELAQKIMRGPKGVDRMVGRLRLIDFPKQKRPLTIADTAAQYSDAIHSVVEASRSGVIPAI
jgi:glycosyltransferase involved in cell wall biosynthesis